MGSWSETAVNKYHSVRMEARVRAPTADFKLRAPRHATVTKSISFLKISGSSSPAKQLALSGIFRSRSVQHHHPSDPYCCSFAALFWQRAEFLLCFSLLLWWPRCPPAGKTPHHCSPADFITLKREKLRPSLLPLFSHPHLEWILLAQLLRRLA